jgi:hypothetical protein
MKTVPRALKAVGIGFVALWVCSLVFAYFISCEEQFQVKNIIGITASGQAAFLGSIIIGTLAVVLYGMPAFFVVSKYGASKWRFVLLSSLVPSALALFYHWKISVFLALFAVPIASAMRLFTGVSPNKALKPLVSLAGTGKAGPLA